MPAIFELHVPRTIDQVSRHLEEYLRQGAQAQIDFSKANGNRETITATVTKESDRAFRLDVEHVGADGHSVTASVTYALSDNPFVTGPSATTIAVDHLRDGQPVGVYERSVIKKAVEDQRAQIEGEIAAFVSAAEHQTGGHELG